MNEIVLQRNRDGYAQLDHMLEQAGMAQSAHHLNWGYAPVAGQEDAVDAKIGRTPNEMSERLVAELIGNLDLNRKRVLDVGCGRGGTLDYVARHFRTTALAGVDLSFENIARSRVLLGQHRARLQVADACNLPHAASSQSVVINLESSGAYPRIEAFFSQVAQILTKEGSFLYGDLWPRPFLPVLDRVLAALGLQEVQLRDVTKQTLAARSASPIALSQHLGGADSEFLESNREFFAEPGSAIWGAMQDGSIAYILGHWRKKGSADISALDADIAALNGRQDWIETRIRQGSPVVGAPPSQGETIDQKPNNPKTASQAADWFRFGAPRRDSKVNVLAFPFAVGGASVFAGWERHLPDDWAFCPVQLPGRENRIKEPAPQRIEDVAKTLVPLIAPYAKVPLVLIGWSLGAKMAYELARQLQDELGIEAALVVAAACPSPQQPIQVGQFSAREYLERLKGTPKQVMDSPDMLNTLEPAIQGDLEMARHYQSDQVIDAPILALEASEDEIVSPNRISGWQRYSRSDFSLRQIKGDHFALRQQVKEVCALIQETYQRLKTPSPEVWLPFDGMPALDRSKGDAPQKPKLLLLHHAGGSARSFLAWKDLPQLSHLNLCPVELPGHGTRLRETPLDCIKQMSTQLFRNLQPVLNGSDPVFLFGHSLGALLAFLLAGRMEKAGIDPAGVLVSARRAPQIDTPEPYRYDMPSARLLTELCGLGGTDQSMMEHPEFAEMFLPIIRADFRATELYRYRTDQQIKAPIMGLLGERDTEVSPACFKGWAEITSGAYQAQTYAGDHFYFEEPATRAQVARDIRDFVKTHMAPVVKPAGLTPA